MQLFFNMPQVSKTAGLGHGAAKNGPYGRMRFHASFFSRFLILPVNDL